MKKLISIVLIITLCMSMGTLAFAEGGTDVELPENSQATMEFNEYEYYVAISNTTDQTLTRSGLTAEEIEEVRSFDFFEELRKRASQPEDVLYSMGYTEEQIVQLKQYLENPEGNYDFEAMSATLVGRIICPSFSADEVIATYWWTWSNMPLWAFTDSMALSWQGYSDGPDNYVECFLGDKSAEVSYYEGNTKVKTITFKGNEFADVPQDSCACVRFSSTIYESGLTLWAKQGEIRCVLTNMSSSRDITDVDCCGAYGYTHSVLSTSLSIGADGLSLTFVPEGRVTTIRKRAVINQSGIHIT